MHLGIIASMKSGLEHFIYREMCEFAKRGATISVFPTKQRPGLYQPPRDWQVHRWNIAKVIGSQPWRLLRWPAQYLRLLIEALRYRALADFLVAMYFAPQMQNVDVLYATFGDRKLFVGYFGKRLLNKPLAVTIHAYELYQNPNPGLFPIALAACDQIITVTEYNRELLCNRFGLSRSQVDVVRLSVDLAEYRPSRRFVVLIVAFFVEKKGHETLFEAVRRMGRDDVEIWVVGGAGGSSNQVDVPALAKAVGLDAQVAFFGKLRGPALRALYRECDVFCLPSRFDSHGEAEGFPTVIIEAMACGKPVVTTRHVEIPRIVEQILVDENETHFSTSNVDRSLQLLKQLAPSTDAPSQPPTDSLQGGVRDCCGATS
jgi:colanic acid/amylovoran biosynthesis glycosyltransferase